LVHLANLSKVRGIVGRMTTIIWQSSWNAFAALNEHTHHRDILKPGLKPKFSFISVLLAAGECRMTAGKLQHLGNSESLVVSRRSTAQI